MESLGEQLEHPTTIQAGSSSSLKFLGSPDRSSGNTFPGNLLRSQSCLLQTEEPSKTLKAESDASEGASSSAAAEGSAAVGRRRRWRRLELGYCWLKAALLLLRRRRLERPGRGRRGGGEGGGGGGGARPRRAETGCRTAAVAAASSSAAQLRETLNAARCVGEHGAAAVLGGQLLAAGHPNTLTVSLLKHDHRPCQSYGTETGNERSRNRPGTGEKHTMRTHTLW